MYGTSNWNVYYSGNMFLKNLRLKSKVAISKSKVHVIIIIKGRRVNVITIIEKLLDETREKLYKIIYFAVASLYLYYCSFTYCILFYKL